MNLSRRGGSPEKGAANVGTGDEEVIQRWGRRTMKECPSLRGTFIPLRGFNEVKQLENQPSHSRWRGYSPFYWELSMSPPLRRVHHNPSDPPKLWVCRGGRRKRLWTGRDERSTASSSPLLATPWNGFYYTITPSSGAPGATGSAFSRLSNIYHQWSNKWTHESVSVKLKDFSGLLFPTADCSTCSAAYWVTTNKLYNIIDINDGYLLDDPPAIGMKRCFSFMVFKQKHIYIFTDSHVKAPPPPVFCILIGN